MVDLCPLKPYRASKTLLKCLEHLPDLAQDPIRS
jgi:hypothetical protein